MADNPDTPEIVSYRLSEVEKALTKLVDVANTASVTQKAMEKDIEAIRSEFHMFRASSTRWIVLIVSALITPILLYLISKIG